MASKLCVWHKSFQMGLGVHVWHEPQQMKVPPPPPRVFLFLLPAVWHSSPTENNPPRTGGDSLQAGGHVIVLQLGRHVILLQGGRSCDLSAGGRSCEVRTNNRESACKEVLLWSTVQKIPLGGLRFKWKTQGPREMGFLKLCLATSVFFLKVLLNVESFLLKVWITKDMLRVLLEFKPPLFLFFIFKCKSKCHFVEHL